MANWCETWNRGLMLKTFVRSARMPVNMKLLRRRSRCISWDTFSTLPGMGRLSLARRSEKDARASEMVATSALLRRKASGDESDDEDAMFATSESVQPSQRSRRRPPLRLQSANDAEDGIGLFRRHVTRIRAGLATATGSRETGQVGGRFGRAKS